MELFLKCDANFLPLVNGLSALLFAVPKAIQRFSIYYRTLSLAHGPGSSHAAARAVSWLFFVGECGHVTRKPSGFYTVTAGESPRSGGGEARSQRVIWEALIIPASYTCSGVMPLWYFLHTMRYLIVHMSVEL